MWYDLCVVLFCLWLCCFWASWGSCAVNNLCICVDSDSLGLCFVSLGVTTDTLVGDHRCNIHCDSFTSFDIFVVVCCYVLDLVGKFLVVESLSIFMMSNPVNVSTASRAALRASRLFSAEEIDAILDLRSSSGVLNWTFLCGVGSINQDRWMRLLRQNAICGQFEEDEGDEDDGRQQDDDVHLGAVGGTGVLNRESEEWQDRMQRMEERLDRMEGTAQEHERLLVAHSVSIDTQRNRLSDVIEFLAESEVGDRNRMMDLLRRQCGMTSSVASPVANRQQNVLDWSMQHATMVDELSSASDTSFRECSPQAQDTIPLVVGSTARDGPSMGPRSYEDQGMFRGQPGTLGPHNNSPRPVNMPATVPQSELHSTQPSRDSHVAPRGLRQNAPPSYGSPQSTHLKVGYPFTVDSTQGVTHGREDRYAPLQNTFLQPTSVSIPQTPVYHPFTSGPRFQSVHHQRDSTPLHHQLPHSQFHGDRMAWAGNAAQQPVQSSGLPQDGTPYEEEMVQLNEGPTKVPDRKTDSGVSSSCAESLAPKSRRKRRTKLRFKADTGDESSEPPSGRKGYRESSMRHKKKEKGGRRLRRERHEDFDSSSSDSSSDSDRETTSRMSHRSSALPKLQAFDGRATHWESFIFQFENLARSSGWSKMEKLESLQSCLRGKAVSFVRSRSEKVKGSYRLLVKALEERYGVKELPGVARRQALSMKQEEGESVDDFADKVLNKVTEGFPEVDDEVLQSLAVDAFLRGCKDRSAAFAAAEKNPMRMQDAIKEVRASAANLRAFGKSATLTRQLSYSDGASVEEKSADKLSRQQIADVQKLIRDNLEVSRQSSRDSSGTWSGRKPSGTTSSNRMCFRCGSGEHMIRDCPSSESLCFHCKQAGHVSKDCPKKKEKAGSSNPDARQASKESGK